MRKTWNEKLNVKKDLPKYEFIGPEHKMAAKLGVGKMLIAAPIEYDEIIQKIPLGKILTSQNLRSILARKHQADFTCPLTAGIFINIVANAARERELRGEVNRTPFWRVVKKDGELNEKYPDGIDGHRFLLEQEGHVIDKRGKRYFLKDYEQSLAEGVDINN